MSGDTLPGTHSSSLNLGGSKKKKKKKKQANVSPTRRYERTEG